MTARALFAAFLVFAALVPCRAERPCFPVDQAPQHRGKDVCLAAHVYDIVTAPDGSRYLDVCPAGADAHACRFAILSPAADRAQVDPLESLQGQDIRIRGTVRSSPAGTYMLLDAERQLHGGAEKFVPNPELAKGFSAASEGTAFRDPALSGRHRTTNLFRGSNAAAK